MLSTTELWEVFDEIENAIGTEELLLNLAKAMGTDELESNLAYIARCFDINTKYELTE